MDIRKLQKQVHKLAIKKGWWEKPRTDAELIMLMVCELSEAVEEIRDGRPAVYVTETMSPAPCPTPGDLQVLTPAVKRRLRAYMKSVRKPEGVLIELADCVIRIMDYCERNKWDLEKAILLKHEFNKTRPHRHGGKVL